MRKDDAPYVTLSQSSRFKKTMAQMRYAILHDKAGLVGFILLVLIVALSVLAPTLFPLDMVSDPSQILQAPSALHILGTDHLGRDIWAQIANGGR
ncbi:MAG: hypothetical protein RSC08_02400, partial [Oscillospiraceae bacterium]